MASFGKEEGASLGGPIDNSRTTTDTAHPSHRHHLSIGQPGTSANARPQVRRRSTRTRVIVAMKKTACAKSEPRDENSEPSRPASWYDVDRSTEPR